jgi:hypothetical protein
MILGTCLPRAGPRFPSLCWSAGAPRRSLGGTAHARRGRGRAALRRRSRTGTPGGDGGGAVFRFMQTRLRAGPRWAVVATSACFAIMHLEWLTLAAFVRGSTQRVPSGAALPRGQPSSTMRCSRPRPWGTVLAFLAQRPSCCRRAAACRAVYHLRRRPGRLPDRALRRWVATRAGSEVGLGAIHHGREARIFELTRRCGDDHGGGAVRSRHIAAPFVKPGSPVALVLEGVSPPVTLSWPTPRRWIASSRPGHARHGAAQRGPPRRGKAASVAGVRSATGGEGPQQGPRPRGPRPAARPRGPARGDAAGWRRCPNLLTCGSHDRSIRRGQCRAANTQATLPPAGAGLDGRGHAVQTGCARRSSPASG